MASFRKILGLKKKTKIVSAQSAELHATTLSGDNLGVFFTCYTEREAVTYALSELYRVYPGIHCLLISDGGENFEDQQLIHPGLKTILAEDSRGFVPKINVATFTHPDEEVKILKSIYTFLNRVQQSIKYCGTEYLLIMEPDALVRGKLIMPGGAKLAGSRVNELGFPELQKELLSHPKGVSAPRFGSVPALLHAPTFQEVHAYILQHPATLRRLHATCDVLANYDVLLPVLFALLGHPEVFNPEIVECLRYPDWEKSGKPLVHQYREKYPKKGSSYTGRHAEQ